MSSPIDDMPSIDNDRGMTEVRVRAPPKEQGMSRPLRGPRIALGVVDPVPLGDQPLGVMLCLSEVVLCPTNRFDLKCLQVQIAISNSEFICVTTIAHLKEISNK